MQHSHSGRAFVPGGFGSPAYSNLPRAEVERLLRIWFAWLQDKTRIHVQPIGHDLSAELQIRRWETRPDLVVFRWRNSDNTRASFSRVSEQLRKTYPEATIEMTQRNRPRALILSSVLNDTLAPLWAMGLAAAAFEAAGVENVSSFKLSTRGTALKNARGTSLDLEPLADSWHFGRVLGRLFGKIAP